MRFKVLLALGLVLVIAAGHFGYTGGEAPHGESAMESRPSKPLDAAASTPSFLTIPKPRPAATSAVDVTPPKGRSVGESIRELTTSSDPNDRFKAYALAYRCSIWKMLDEQIRMTVKAERTEAHPELDQYRGACDGVSDRQLSSRYDNLKVAVAANVSGAAHQFFVESPFGDHDALTQRPDDPLVVQWKAQVVDGLKHAAEGGDRTAITDLMQLYDSGVIVQRDPVQSLSYLLVENKIADQSGHPHKSGYLQKASKAFTPDQIDAATAQANALHDRCCARH